LDPSNPDRSDKDPAGCGILVASIIRIGCLDIRAIRVIRGQPLSSGSKDWGRGTSDTVLIPGGRGLRKLRRPTREVPTEHTEYTEAVLSFPCIPCGPWASLLGSDSLRPTGWFLPSKSQTKLRPTGWSLRSDSQTEGRPEFTEGERMERRRSGGAASPPNCAG